MEFEFDPAQGKVNKNKHGIDFVDAQSLWDDPDFVELPAATTGERRWLVIGRIAGKYWSGIITYRDNRILTGTKALLAASMAFSHILTTSSRDRNSAW